MKYISGNPFDRLKPLQDVLQQDVSLLMDRCAAKIRPFNAGDASAEEVFFWYRALGRAFLVQVDGLTGVMRDVVLKASQLGLLQVPPEVKDKLSRVDGLEEGEEGGSQGGRLSFLEAVELTLSQFGRITKVEGCRKGDFRFAYFKALASWRNQITHPERLEDWMGPLD